MAIEVDRRSIEDEIYREYEFLDTEAGQEPTVYHIDNPVALWVGTTTHRVLDSDGVVHCVPFPKAGNIPVVLRWKSRTENPVAF
jgi:hypothetical protein